MSRNARESFVLFDVGHNESALRLGDLVLFNYKDPLAARHHTCQRKAKEDEIHSTRLSKFSVFHKHGPRAGIQLQLANFVNLGANLAQERTRLLIAGSAERITLQNPTEYLKDVVLADKSAREVLSIWLSAASTDRLRRFKLARDPKIWMMTGLYMLEDVKVITARSQSVGGEVGISSELLTALTAVPVGISVNGSRGVSAEYHLINAKFINSSKSVTSDVMSKITLYPDITSKGLLRNVKASVNAFLIGPFEEDVNATVEELAGSNMLYINNGEDGTSEDGFLKAFEEIVELYEEELHSDTPSEDEDED